MLNELNREAVTEIFCAGSPRTAMSDPLPAPIWQDALSLCRDLQCGNLSAQTLMANIYARINTLNPALNALVDLLPEDQAMALAAEADAVPVSVRGPCTAYPWHPRMPSL